MPSAEEPKPFWKLSVTRMNTDQITVGGLTVQIVRKQIKNLHLGVYPPNGRVRVAAPLAVNDDAIRLAVIGKLGWIKRQKAKFSGQSRQSEREMVTGETHYFLGRRYRLRVISGKGAGRIVIRNKSTMELHAPAGSTASHRLEILYRWYREQLRSLLPPVLAKWQPVLEVSASACGIRRMKTKWGSCTIPARRILVNLELVKKPVKCLEYIIVHELIHLHERHHNDRFIALMDRHLPNWRKIRDHLNAAPLAHESWGY